MLQKPNSCLFHYFRYSLFILFLSYTGQAQSYRPLHANKDDFAALKELLADNLKTDISALSDPYKNEISFVYQQRYNNLIQQIEKGYFISDPQITSYFNNIFNKIIQANPDLKKNRPKLLISRYTWPNASCLGEGTIILNIDLVRRLENPGQLAFVLSHELAHLNLNHVNNAIASNVAILNSKETKKKIKKASKSEYSRNAKITDVLKDVVYEDRRHGREHEKEADSLAAHYMHNSNYNLYDAIRTLEILDSVDSEKYYHNIDLAQVFQSTEYPFDTQWTAAEQSLSFGFETTSYLNADSLKTHPNCSKRITWFKQEIQQLNLESDNPIHDQKAITEFNQIANISDFEVIESEYLFKNYGQCLYRTLLMLNKFPKSAYLHSIVGKCFYEIYQAQKKHELTTSVDLPSHIYDEEYNKVLRFIHNLRLSEIAQIGYYYMQKHAENHLQNEEFLYALILTSQTASKSEEIPALKKKYKDQFSDGKYISIINK